MQVKDNILEHRHVMSLILGRELKRCETVHHKNRDTRDNRPENLELWSSGHPCGQRVDELLDYVIANYRPLLLAKLASQ